jgi:hypothetical protein
MHRPVLYSTRQVCDEHMKMFRTHGRIMGGIAWLRRYRTTTTALSPQCVTEV